MSFKIFVVLAMVLVMSSLSIAAAPPGYGYQPPGGGGDQDLPLDIELDSSCDENVVTIYRKNTPQTISGAHVTVVDITDPTDPTPPTIFSGDTDGNGQISFRGCGKRVRIYVTKAGYTPEQKDFDLIDCGQCCGDGVCDAELGENEQTCPEDCGEPAAEPEENGEEEEGAPEGEEGEGGPPEGEGMRCTVNEDCEGTEYCDIPSTETVYGTCEPVAGVCGYAEDHAWVGYECGPETGCPACGTGYTCEDHECVAVAAPGEEEEEDEGEAAPTGEAGEEDDLGAFLLWLLGLLILLGIILGGIVWWRSRVPGRKRH